MKAMEHCGDVNGNVIDFYILGKGCEMVSKQSHVTVSPVGIIVRKWKLNRTIRTPPRRGRAEDLDGAW